MTEALSSTLLTTLLVLHPVVSVDVDDDVSDWTQGASSCLWRTTRNDTAVENQECPSSPGLFVRFTQKKVAMWPWPCKRIANVQLEHCLLASGRPLEFRRAGFGGGCVPMIVSHPTRRALTK
jgi:hypothetical protein